MQTYKEFPPFKSFQMCLQACPEAAYIYSQLWNLKDKNHQIIMRRKDVKKKLLTSPTLLRNCLLDLSRIYILTFDDNNDIFRIAFEYADE